MTKEEKDILKKLKKEENYDEIFKQFGQKQFSKNVSRKYKKQDIKKLKKEGKFEDVYLRYGKSQYNRLLNEAKQREIEEVYGKRSAKAIGNKIKTRVKSAFGALLIGTGMLSGAGTLALGTTIYQSEKIKAENRETYEEVIDNYEKQIENYAENVKAMNLTDLEIFMKLQEDIHKSILGYGTPELDIEGYFGVDIGKQWSGYGVCRSMADDMTRKLNAINPDYNARMIAVRVSGNEIEMPNVSKHRWEIQKKDKNKFDQIAKDTWGSKYEFAISDDIVISDDILLANHAVVAVDIKEENITLVIDPTNPCIGVFKEGKITIFNSLNMENGFTLERRPLHEAVYRGIKSLEIPSEYTKSFLNPNTTIEELNEKYGVEAQNLALASAQAKDKEYIYSKSKKSNFRNSLKVDLKNQETSIYSPSEIEEVYNKCTQEVYNLNTAKETLELCNYYRKLMYSIDYYSQQETEILGKPTLHMNEETIRTFNIYSTHHIEEGLASAMIKTDSVFIPENCNNKETLCKGYLRAKGSEKIEDLKITIDDSEQGDSTYWILNDKKWLISVDNKGLTTYNNPITDKKGINVKELLEKSQPIVKGSQRDANKEIDGR